MNKISGTRNFPWAWGSPFEILDIGGSECRLSSVPLLCNKTFPVVCAQNTGKVADFHSGPPTLETSKNF